MAKAQPLPKRYRSALPAILVTDAHRALEFYARAFGVEVEEKYLMPDGSIGHAAFRHGDTLIGLAEANPDWGLAAPDPLAASSSSITLWVEDVDVVFARALAAGATQVSAVADQFHGARSGTLRCPFGHRWILATFLEDVPQDVVQQRLNALFAASV